MGWRNWLATGRATEKSGRVTDIDRVRSLRDITALEEALASDNVLVRVAALQALAAISDAAATTLLARAMKDCWRSVRIVASESAAKLIQTKTGAFAVPADVGTIPADALAARCQAARALAPELFAQYVDALDNPDAALRLAAAEVLGETGSADAAASLIKALADTDMAVVSQANESLVQLGAVAVPSLQDASHSANTMVRDSATWCLGQIQSARH